MKADTFGALQTARRAKTPVALVFDLDGGGHEALVYADRVKGELPEAMVTEARARLRDDKSGLVEMDGTHWFIDCHNPPLRVIVIGAVHITQTLAPMAAIAGYEVIVVDPRASFATSERFPNVQLLDEWPDDAMVELAPDARTAVITLTHDPKLDDPALMAALAADVFYIGALGSTRTHGKRLERMAEAGFAPEHCARIHGPIGLDIGAASPAEIAVSILAEMIRVLRKGG